MRTLPGRTVASCFSMVATDFLAAASLSIWGRGVDGASGCRMSQPPVTVTS